jgi:hypothetical protein
MYRINECFVAKQFSIFVCRNIENASILPLSNIRCQERNYVFYFVLIHLFHVVRLFLVLWLFPILRLSKLEKLPASMLLAQDKINVFFFRVEYCKLYANNNLYANRNNLTTIICNEIFSLIEYDETCTIETRFYLNT